MWGTSNLAHLFLTKVEALWSSHFNWATGVPKSCTTFLRSLSWWVGAVGRAARQPGSTPALPAPLQDYFIIRNLLLPSLSTLSTQIVKNMFIYISPKTSESLPPLGALRCALGPVFSQSPLPQGHCLRSQHSDLSHLSAHPLPQHTQLAPCYLPGHPVGKPQRWGLEGGWQIFCHVEMFALNSEIIRECLKITMLKS